MKSYSLYSLSVAVLSSVALFTYASASLAQEEKKAATTSSQSRKTEAEKTGEWLKISPTDAGASFEAPIKPRYVERSFSPIKGKPPIKVRLHLATINEGSTTFIFGYHDLHEKPGDDKAVAAALDGAVKGSVTNVFGQLVGSPTRIVFKGATGRQFVYRYQQTQKLPNSEETINKIFVVTARVFLLGKRQYQISCLMDSSVFDEQLAGKFLNSFQLVEAKKAVVPEK